MGLEKDTYNNKILCDYFLPLKTIIGHHVITLLEGKKKRRKEDNKGQTHIFFAIVVWQIITFNIYLLLFFKEAFLYACKKERTLM